MSKIKRSTVKLIKGILQTTSGTFDGLVTSKKGIVYLKPEKKKK